MSSEHTVDSPDQVRTKTLPADAADSRPAASTRTSFWSRHKTMINFWLDVGLAGLFLVLSWLMIVVHFVFPRSEVHAWTIWGATEADFRDYQFGVFCVFSLGIVVHVMFHWDWICATVSTRLLKRKAGKDDGTLTLIGVGILVVLIHLVIGGVLAARLSLTNVS